MKPYIESILYLKSITAIVESMDEKKDENHIKTNIGILTDVKNLIQKLIKTLEKMDK
jgi:hypothetical protein